MIEILKIDPKIKQRDPKELLETPRVVRVNGFDEKAVKDFSVGMSLAQLTGQPIIPVVIDTYGGDVYGLLAMIDMIRSSPIPVATIMEGKAMSAGAILLACGAPGYRYVAPNASLMLHDLSVKEPSRKIEEIKITTKESDRINKRVFQIMDENCGRPVGATWDAIYKRSHCDWYLSPKQAVEEKFADYVGLPTLTTRVIVKFKFGL